MCSYCHHKLSLVARQQEARGRKTRERRRDAIEIALYKALLASQHVDKE